MVGQGQGWSGEGQQGRTGVPGEAEEVSSGDAAWQGRHWGAAEISWSPSWQDQLRGSRGSGLSVMEGRSKAFPGCFPPHAPILPAALGSSSLPACPPRVCLRHTAGRCHLRLGGHRWTLAAPNLHPHTHHPLGKQRGPLEFTSRRRDWESCTCPRPRTRPVLSDDHRQ